MRAVDPRLQAALDSGATTLCDCWRIDRSDGVSLGFTDHDEPVAFDGLVFEAEAGATGSATESALGLSIDSGQIEGALRSDAISAEDVAAGLWDGARARRWRVDWRDPELRMLVFSGFLGEIERGAHGFTTQLDGLSAALNRPRGRAFLPLCDARLGDGRCGVDLDAAGRHALGTVAEAPGGAAVVVELARRVEARWAERGRLLWAGGRNAGCVSMVRAQPLAGTRLRLELQAAAPFQPALGDALRLEVGCDRRIETCAARFGNAVNFRGFPAMPGEGWLAAGPVAGERNDGGSRG